MISVNGPQQVTAILPLADSMALPIWPPGFSAAPICMNGKTGGLSRSELSRSNSPILIIPPAPGDSTELSRHKSSGQSVSFMSKIFDCVARHNRHPRMTCQVSLLFDKAPDKVADKGALRMGLEPGVFPALSVAMESQQSASKSA
jgi:hypothetical protein